MDGARNKPSRKPINTLSSISKCGFQRDHLHPKVVQVVNIGEG